MKFVSYQIKPYLLIGLSFQLILLPWMAVAKPIAKVSHEQTMERNVIAIVNEYRVKRGLSKLKASSIIAYEAKIHSQDMERKRMAFGHDDFPKRIQHIYRKIHDCNGGSENIAWYPPNKSPREVVALWLTSSGHRRNILGHYNLTGVGIVRDKRGWLYYTQIFIKRENRASTAVPSSGLFLKRQTRYAQTSDVLKNKPLDGTAVEAENKGIGHVGTS